MRFSMMALAVLVMAAMPAFAQTALPYPPPTNTGNVWDYDFEDAQAPWYDSQLDVTVAQTLHPIWATWAATNYSGIVVDSSNGSNHVYEFYFHERYVGVVATEEQLIADNDNILFNMDVFFKDTIARWESMPLGMPARPGYGTFFGGMYGRPYSGPITIGRYNGDLYWRHGNSGGGDSRLYLNSSMDSGGYAIGGGTLVDDKDYLAAQVEEWIPMALKMTKFEGVLTSTTGWTTAEFPAPPRAGYCIHTSSQASPTLSGC